MDKLIERNKYCRSCKGTSLVRVFSFGPTACANAFVKEKDLYGYEYIFPLDVYFCKTCSLLQMRDVVSREFMFKDYVYVSSMSPVFIKHFEDFAGNVFQRFDLNKESLVVDIGSNDGILLKPFKKMGARVLGVEPAKTVAKIARDNGVPSVPEFFSKDLARTLAKKYGHADVMTATNVFAHVNDLDDLVGGVASWLKPDGVFIIEVPYLINFIDNNLFDTVYHEHLSYFSVNSLSTLLSRLGMKIFDVQLVSSHGGSIRVFIKKKVSNRKVENSVAGFLKKEKKARLADLNTYRKFNERVQKNKAALIALLSRLKSLDKKIAGYGAPGKGNTLLNFFGIGSDLLDYIVDDSPPKQGLYTPGKRIPVVGRGRLEKEHPDYLLIIAWNFAESIINNNKKFKKAGGKFIIPVPRPRII